MLPTHSLASGTTGGSGALIPRFVSLKSDEVNVRKGPGTRYPILWVYRRANMPLEIIEEFEEWRKIRDAENTIGWVHRTMLEGSRNAIIKGKKPQIVRIDHEKDAKPLLKIEPTVIVSLLKCTKSWCRIKVNGSKGWIEKRKLWGVYSEETM